MGGKLLSSSSWWLPQLRQRIFYGSAVLSSTQGSSGELLTTRVPPFCPLVHAFTVHVLAGLQYEQGPTDESMCCCRLLLPEAELASRQECRVAAYQVTLTFIA